jgi:hypothetical protein
VTVFYNRGSLVDESIGSLLRQTCSNLEVIAVDDGSSDDTRRRLEAIMDRRLRVVSHPNQGFTSSMRQAIALARGPLVAVHGAGDISLPERLRRQADLMQADTELGVVGCHFQNRDEATGKTETFTPQLRRDAHAELVRQNPFSHGEVMFRRSVYDAVGGYRPFFMMAQDRDLWLRMSHRTAFAILPETLYIRRQLAGGIRRSNLLRARQMLYSEFAMHCDATRGPAGDPLDRLGNAAALVFTPSRALADKILDLAAKAIVDEKADEAAALLQLVPAASQGALGRGFRAAMTAAERGRLPLSLLQGCAHLLRKQLKRPGAQVDAGAQLCVQDSRPGQRRRRI